MPLDRFVLILVLVLVAALATVWLASLAAAAFEVPMAWSAFIPIALAAYVLWRVIADRIRSRADDHYDRIEK